MGAEEEKLVRGMGGREKEGERKSEGEEGGVLERVQTQGGW